MKVSFNNQKKKSIIQTKANRPIILKKAKDFKVYNQVIIIITNVKAVIETCLK